MANYYVRKTGNDTTGDGSTGNPWLTINKAITTVLAGSVIVVGNGTYSENSGSGYLSIAKALTIQSESGTASDVVITSPTVSGGGSATFGILIADVVAMLNITIQSSDTGRVAACHGNAGGISFTNVRFIGAGNATARACFISQPFAGNTALTFTNCTFSDDGLACDGIKIITLTATNTIKNLAITNCTFSNSNYSIRLGDGNNARVQDVTITGGSISAVSASGLSLINGVTNLTISNFSASGSADGFGVLRGDNIVISGSTFFSTAGHGLSIGSDAVTATTVTGSMTGCTIGSTTGHGLLLGYGATNYTVSNCTMNGGDYGLVIKHSTGCTVSGCTIRGGSVSAIYYKAATDATVDSCAISASTGVVILLGPGDSAAKCQNCTLTNSRVSTSGSASIFNWDDSDGDSGGGVCDYNVYSPKGSGLFGSVYGTSGLKSMSSLRNAWLVYDVPSNDSHSRIYDYSGGINPVGRSIEFPRVGIRI